MSRFGLTTSGSYTSQSPNAADDRLSNWYNETNEDPNGKSPMSLLPSPGLGPGWALTGASVRGMIPFNGRAFSVAGVNFYELVIVGGAYHTTNNNVVANDNNLVSFAAGPNQILLASAGILYVFDLTANTLTPVDPATYTGPISQVAYCDGFFIALTANSNRWQYSSPDDSTTWDLTNSTLISTFPDNIVGFIVAYRQPIFFGTQKTQPYYDSGNLFTFDAVQGGLFEQGAVSGTAISFLDNSVFWLGQDARGQAIAWRLNGYTPTRISTHATEFAWQGYSTVADAISYSYQDQGHTFWHLYFPTAGKSWRYDAATGIWHEVEFFNGGNAIAHRSQCYMFAFGKHFVGDWKSGNIYEMNIKYLTDFGNPIKRLRRAPHISNENQWMFHSELRLDVETGLGPQPPLRDGAGNPRDPQIMIRFSDDGGHTWSQYHSRGCGQAGKFKTQVVWYRLGRSRDRIYEFSATDPVPYRIIDGYLLAEPSFTRQERISSQLRKVS